ncbi:hypothetical protein GJ744_010028 [Endocarpon pusillum]|uniref:Fungal N-terminal domain-containing protein n=1 Tax=Endocarpon pusillum TaxID=364733 RepID=A0A8H7E285_9EURO|nr:hypothetical protein GJ744_010028 [Endocarpon pusillum]
MAGFGVSVGDVVALSKLGINLYRGCKGAGDAYDALSDEVDRFRAIVQSLQNALPTQPSINTTIDRRQNEELSLILRNAEGDLTKWVEILHKHRNVGSGSSRSKWTADMRFATTDDASAIQKGLVSHTRSLTLFMSTLTSRRIEHIESHLERILSEVQNGFRNFGVQAQSEDDNIISLEAAQWEALQKELLGDGFVPEDISAHKAWFEERLREIDIMPTSVLPAHKTKSPSPQQPTATPTPLDAVENWKPKEPLFRLCEDTFVTIHGSGGKQLNCIAGDEFALLSVAKIRPHQADLWLCRHVTSSNIVLLEASSLNPSVQGMTEVEWRQSALSKGLGAETPPILSRRQSNWTDGTSASSTQVQSHISDTARTSLVPSDSSSLRLIRNGNEPLVSPKNNLDRRTSDLPRPHSATVFSTTPPARPPSRPQSVRSEISEYGPDGKLIKTKTITTTYSAEVNSHSQVQTPNQTRTSHNEHSTSEPDIDNILCEPHSADFLSRTRSRTRSNSHETHAGTDSKPSPASEPNPKTNATFRDYEKMYTSRTRQLKTLVRKLVELNVIRYDPLSYYYDEVEVAAGDYAVEEICHFLAESGSGSGMRGGERRGVTRMRKTKLYKALVRRGGERSSNGGVGLDIVGKGPKGGGGVLNWICRFSSRGDGGGGGRR